MTHVRGYFSALAEEARATRYGHEVEGLRRLRRALRSARIDDHPPRDLEALASHLSVSEIRTTPLAMRGRITVDGPYVSIELNADDPPFVQRLTLAHELAHLIVEDGRVQAAVRKGRAPEPLSPRKYDEVELVCDMLAAELLLPEEWLIEQVNLDEPSLAVAQCLAGDARVSVEFLVRRAIDRGLWRALAIGWIVTRDEAHVAWITPDRGDAFRAANRVPLGKAHLIERARASAQSVQGSLALRLTDHDEVVDAQACVADDQAVVVLIPRD